MYTSKHIRKIARYLFSKFTVDDLIKLAKYNVRNSLKIALNVDDYELDVQDERENLESIRKLRRDKKLSEHATHIDSNVDIILDSMYDLITKELKKYALKPLMVSAWRHDTEWQREDGVFPVANRRLVASIMRKQLRKIETYPPDVIEAILTVFMGVSLTAKSKYNVIYALHEYGLNDIKMGGRQESFTVKHNYLANYVSLYLENTIRAVLKNFNNLRSQTNNETSRYKAFGQYELYGVNYILNAPNISLSMERSIGDTSDETVTLMDTLKGSDVVDESLVNTIKLILSSGLLFKAVRKRCDTDQVKLLDALEEYPDEKYSTLYSLHLNFDYYRGSRALLGLRINAINSLLLDFPNSSIVDAATSIDMNPDELIDWIADNFNNTDKEKLITRFIRQLRTNRVTGADARTTQRALDVLKKQSEFTFDQLKRKVTDKDLETSISDIDDFVEYRTYRGDLHLSVVHFVIPIGNLIRFEDIDEIQDYVEYIRNRYLPDIAEHYVPLLVKKIALENKYSNLDVEQTN